MDKKALKPVIITAVALVLLVGAYFLLKMLPETPPEEASPSPTPTKAPEAVYLYKEDYYDLTRMEFDFRDEMDFAIDVDDSGDARAFIFSPAKEGWKYSQNEMRSTAFNIVTISAVAEVAKNVTDFREYELDAPMLIARSYYDTADGEVVREIHIGKITSLEDSYYARMKGGDTVYAISKYVAENLMTMELKYRELDFFPSYLSEDKLKVEAESFITYIRVHNPGTGSDIEISMRSDKELGEMPLGSTRYYMSKPIKSDCNDTIVVEKLINVAAGITISAVVEDEPEDLGKYGLDDPLHIWMKNTDGQEVHYLIGEGSGTSAYAMVEGANTVLIADMFSPKLRELNYLEFMFKLFWLHNINDVKSVIFDLEGDKQLLDIKVIKKNEAGKVEEFEATLNGRPLSETNTRRLYMRMLDMMIAGELTESVDIETVRPDYTFTIVMNDGSREELRLFRLNERQYAGSLNGEEAAFYVNVASIRKLKEAFAYIERGEEIPR